MTKPVAHVTVMVDRDEKAKRADRWLANQLGGCLVRTVKISTLLPGDSPRRSGPDRRHAQTLADLDDHLPPIIVHGPSMKVIDGMHRVQAALERGDEDISALIYPGPENDAFVIAVKMNVAHGLPLPRSDRAVAAGRIMLTHPEWSNRMIASLSGVAAGTVTAARKRSTGRSIELEARVGLDGRVRPLNSAAGRQLAGRLLADRPTASLRTIAQEAGVSPSTVQDVRQRLHAGMDPVPHSETTTRTDTPIRRGRAGQRDGLPQRRPWDQIDAAAALTALKQDPTLRYNESGRGLLRLLELNLAGAELCRLTHSVPEYLIENIARLSLCCAAVWENAALQLQRQLQQSG